LPDVTGVHHFYRSVVFSGWIDEATSEVTTSLLVYSPRKDVFVHNVISFLIDGEGTVKSQYTTRTIKLSDDRSEFNLDGGGFDKWTGFRTWMWMYMVAYMLFFLVELCSVCFKSRVESVVPDDPQSPEKDAYLFCRSLVAPWVIDKVLLNTDLQRLNPQLWPDVGKNLDDPSATLGQEIKVPWSFRRQIRCPALPSRLAQFLVFAIYYAAEVYWLLFQNLIKHREERCMLGPEYLSVLETDSEKLTQFFGGKMPQQGPDPGHRSFPGCFSISLPPDPNHRNELELVMDTMESLEEAEDEYQLYRQLMAWCVALTFIVAVTFLDSVKGVDRFVAMLKLALS
jgi:hypothetical protein